MTDNPLLRDDPLPPFPEIRPDHVEPAIDALLAECRETLEGLLATGAPPTWDNFVAPLEAAHDRLSKAWSPVRHMNAVVNEQSLREAYNACLPKLSAYHTEVAQDERVFRAYQRVAADATLDRARAKAVDDAQLEFRLAGVSLPEERRRRFSELVQRLSELSSRFQEHLLDATNAWTRPATAEELDGLPESALGMARQAAERAGVEGYQLNLEPPTFLAVMTHARSRELRREIYEAYVTRASETGPHGGRWDNTPLMEEIVACRREQAALLGYGNYAEVAMERRMARTPEEVRSFLTELAERARSKAEAELEEVRRFAAESEGVKDLQAWDLAYFSERLREQRFELTEEELRPYFSAEAAVGGLFQVAGRLFGVRFEPRSDVPFWHPDVRYYELLDADGTVRGGLYLDLYARPHKRGGAWMDECRVRRRIGSEGGIQLPVAYLTCNFTPPVGGKPALLTHEEVVTLFHEFGHTLHHLLTRQEWQPVSGIHGVEWDAVELPSQLLENWCWEREALDLFAVHHETGERLPEDLHRRLRATRDFQAGMKLLRQLEFSLFDLELHTLPEAPDAAGIQAVLDGVRERVAVVRPPEFNRFQHSFAHIFAGGYAAGYYSYKWAEVLSADAFERFVEEGLFNPDTGRDLARAILEQGGSAPARELFRAFRGREPSIEPLLRQMGLAA